jgi:hypothetical protein
LCKEVLFFVGLFPAAKPLPALTNVCLILYFLASILEQKLFRAVSLYGIELLKFRWFVCRDFPAPQLVPAGVRRDEQEERQEVQPRPTQLLHVWQQEPHRDPLHQAEAQAALHVRRLR